MHTFSDLLFARLLYTTIQTTLLIGALWLLVRCIPRLSPAMRCSLWWLVGAQLLLGLLVSRPLTLPWLRAAATPTQAMHVVVSPDNPRDRHDAATAMAVPATHPSNAFDTAASPWSWRDIVLAAWLLMIAVQSHAVVRQWRKRRKLIHEATPIHEQALQQMCIRQVQALGLRRCPPLLRSAAIASPQVTGMLRPIILFPAIHALNADESAMALAHEMAHIRRGDLWLGWIPALAQRLFFFHPLVHWAMREYSLHREAACDARVLQQPQLEPRDYGRLLLRLGVSAPLHSSLAGASPTFRTLKRRMLMLQQISSTPARAWGWGLVAAVALLGILPYRLTAAHAAQTDGAQSSNGAFYVPVPPLPPPPPVPPQPTLSTPPPPSPPPPSIPSDVAIYGSSGYAAKHMDIDIDADAQHGFVLFDGDSLIINGTDADSRAAHRYVKPPAPMLWYRTGEDSYVVRDANLIQQARDTYAAMTAIAREQGKLAGQQGELSGEQAGLAAREAALAQRQAELESRRAELKASQEATRENAQQTDPDGQRALGELKGIDAQAAEIDREHADLHQREQALAQHEQALSREMETLSAKQKDTAQQVDARMNQLLQDAKAHGMAEPVSR